MKFIFAFLFSTTLWADTKVDLSLLLGDFASTKCTINSAPVQESELPKYNGNVEYTSSHAMLTFGFADAETSPSYKAKVFSDLDKGNQKDRDDEGGFCTYESNCYRVARGVECKRKIGGLFCNYHGKGKEEFRFLLTSADNQNAVFQYKGFKNPTIECHYKKR